MQKKGKKIGHAHFNHIMPLPSNTKSILESYRNVVVCELNNGQFVKYLRSEFPQIRYMQYNKIQGLPFFTGELIDKFTQLIEENGHDNQ
jgi:2-oxoglutarate/2-oxoacid ferredoxin oxidoreductase subunit alpha